MTSQKGFILFVALLVMMLLSLLGMLFLEMSLTECNIAENGYHQAKAFNIAEAGLEHGKQALAGSNIIPILVQGGLFTFGPSVPFDGGAYQVVLTNNCTPVNGHSADIAGCAGANGDGDSLAIITSTGVYQGATVTIGALVKRLPGSGGTITEGWWEVQ